MSIIDNISIWSGRVFSFIALCVVGTITVEVVLRYIFNAPTIWAHESMVYLCAIYYFIGGAYAFYLKSHVKIDVFYIHLSNRAKAIVDLITFPVLLIYLAVLIWTGADLGWSSFLSHETSGSTWSPPLYPVKLSIPVGAFLLLLQAIVQFIRDFRTAIAKKTST